LNQLAESSGTIAYPEEKYARRAALQLIALKAAKYVPESGNLIAVQSLVSSGSFDKSALKQLLENTPGGKSAIDAIVADPNVSAEELGKILQGAYNTRWAEATITGMGKHFKGWAGHAGVKTARTQRKKTIVKTKNFV
jgi:hypothetical protein